jgi:hypothetical protein
MKSTNLDIAKKACLEFHNKLTEHKIKCEVIYFGENVNYGPDGDEENAFNKAIFVTSDYFKNDFMKFYSIAREAEEKYEKDKFNIGFSSILYSKNINEAALTSDGFVHRYKDGKWKTNVIDLSGKIVKTKWI